MKIKIITITSLIFGFIAGIIFTGVTISVSSGEMMVKEFISPFDFDKTVTIVTDRINGKEGWRVTQVIDQNKEAIEHGGFPIGNYKIIKYCNGGFSAQMLKEDDRKKVGNMMTKSFAVYEKSTGQVFISTMNGEIMGKLFGGEIERIFGEASLEVGDIMRFLNLRNTLF